MKKIIFAVILITKFFLYGNYEKDFIARADKINSEVEAVLRTVTSLDKSQKGFIEEKLKELQEEFDNIYRLLMKSLSFEEQEKLEEDQKLWEKEREKTMDIVRERIKEKEKNHQWLMEKGGEFEIIRQRVITLAKRYDSIQNKVE